MYRKQSVMSLLTTLVLPAVAIAQYAHPMSPHAPQFQSPPQYATPQASPPAPVYPSSFGVPAPASDTAAEAVPCNYTCPTGCGDGGAGTCGASWNGYCDSGCSSGGCGGCGDCGSSSYCSSGNCGLLGGCAGCDDCGGCASGGVCGSGRFGLRGRSARGLLSGCGLFSRMRNGGIGDGYGTCRPARIWADADYLLWWNKDRPIPVLATSSPLGTALNDAGILGRPDTSTLFGGRPINDDPSNGFRVSGGAWLTPDQVVGIGGRYFMLEEDVNFSRSSDGDPNLARPFVDTVTGLPSALLVAFPNVATGTVRANNEHEITGGDAFVRKLIYAGYGNRFDVIGGYQYSQIDDVVTVGHTSTVTDPNGRFPIGTVIDSSDVFDVQNQFHGGNFGIMARSDDGRVTWKLLAKVGFGNMRESVTIRGQTTVTDPTGDVAVQNIGLLALPSNIGTYEQNDFAIVPEGGVNVGLRLTRNVDVVVGYSIIYWTRAVLAGDLIDTTINTNQLIGLNAGEPRPAFTFEDRSFWAQGLNFGVDVKF